MSERAETYGKYIFRRKRGGKVQIFARVGYVDKNGQLKYRCRLAQTEEQAVKIAQRMIDEIRRRPLLNFTDEDLTELFFAVQYREIEFRDFRRKIIDFCLGEKTNDDEKQKDAAVW